MNVRKPAPAGFVKNIKKYKENYNDEKDES